MRIVQLTLTIRNCIRLRTFRHFKILYDVVDIPVNRDYSKNYGFIQWKKKPFKLNQIVIGNMSSKIELDTTLYHEIGHLIDFKKKSHIITKYVGAKNDRTVVEKNAWKECIRLAREYDIELCYESAVKWLASYNTSYRTLDNLASNKRNKDNE